MVGGGGSRAFGCEVVMIAGEERGGGVTQLFDCVIFGQPLRKKEIIFLHKLLRALRATAVRNVRR